MSDFETINYSRPAETPKASEPRIEKSDKTSDRRSRHHEEKQTDSHSEAPTTENPSEKKSSRHSSRHHSRRTYRHSKKRKEQGDRSTDPEQREGFTHLENEKHGDRSSDSNHGDRSTDPEHKEGTSDAHPLPALKLLDPVEENRKNPFNLNLFNNIGVDADTLILLGLILLFMQEEHQDTLMVCILAYILLG